MPAPEVPDYHTGKMNSRAQLYFAVPISAYVPFPIA